MKEAIRFVSQCGLESAKSLMRMGSGVCKLNDGEFHTDQLKEIIEAWELVQVHGLSKSKDIVDDAPSDDLYYSWLLGESGIKDKTVHIGTLRKAITLVEEVESLREEG